MKTALEKLKENTNTDDKARELWGIIYSNKEMEFAEDLAENIVPISYVTCEIHNITEQGTDLTPLGILIKGITNWSAHWFWGNDDGSIEDLTNEKIDMVIDDIISNLEQN